MRWNRPFAIAVTVAASVAATTTTHAAPPPEPPPPTLAEIAERVATTEKDPTDLVAGGGAATRIAEQRHGSNAPVTQREHERSNRTGRNDSLRRAERIHRFGTGRHDDQDVLITGTLADVGPTPVEIAVVEDDGAIPFANPTGLSAEAPAVRARGAIGDGPHGTAGTGTGDFDFYAITDADAGQLLTVDIDAVANGSGLDAVVAVLDASGNILAFNDDSPELDSFVQVELPGDGDYLVAVAAFDSLPTNPFDPGSGTGARSEGPYDITMAFEFAEDIDVYRVDMRAGDVLGAALQGSGRVLEVFDPSGTEVVGSGRDLTATYPDDSPLNVAGNATLDHVAAVDGPHYLRVSRGAGDYQVDLRIRRPGIEAEPPGSRQILYLDFDGAFIEPGTFGDAPGGDLSPLSDFIAGWGLTVADESALIDAIVARFEENVVQDPAAFGGNDRFAVEVRNSRDDPDPFGQPNVSRIVIGGTREQLGFDTVGLSPVVDPGNFSRDDTAVVLLDQASAPAGSGVRTINDFVTPDTDVIGLVGSILGFVASHEAGHFLGLWHTQPNNGIISIMDTFDITQIGLGPDLVFGTADDVDVDFVVDQLIEGLAGAQDTMARIAWALSSPQERRR